jgi:hypothetical protein
MGNAQLQWEYKKCTRINTNITATPKVVINFTHWPRSSTRGTSTTIIMVIMIIVINHQVGVQQVQFHPISQ